MVYPPYLLYGVGKPPFGVCPILEDAGMNVLTQKRSEMLRMSTKNQLSPNCWTVLVGSVCNQNQRDPNPKARVRTHVLRVLETPNSDHTVMRKQHIQNPSWLLLTLPEKRTPFVTLTVRREGKQHECTKTRVKPADGGPRAAVLCHMPLGKVR